MTLTDRQRTDRLRKRLTELELWTVRAEAPLEGWSFDGQAARPRRAVADPRRAS